MSEEGGGHVSMLDGRDERSGAVDGTTTPVRLSREATAALDTAAASLTNKPSRAELMGQIVTEWLARSKYLPGVDRE